MQAPVSQNDVVLAWSLQSALSGGLAVACAGLAVTFRRPAMRLLAVFWSLMMVASIFIWSALGAASLGLGPRAGSLFAALAFPLTPVLSFVLSRHLLQLLAGRDDRDFPAPRLLAAAGTIALIFSFGLRQFTDTAGTPGTAGTAPVMAVVSAASTILAYSILVGLAWGAYRGATEHRGAIRLFGASFLLLAVRSATNLGVAALSAMRGESPAFGVAVTTLQISLLVIAGVLQLIAVLNEERASIVKRTDQLRAAEAAIATSQRLEGLGRMAGAVAHDFNNLLTVISLSAESARATATGEGADDLDEISASSKRGQELTRQLLAFARQAPQQVSQFDANVQLDKLRGLLQRLVGQNATLQVSVTGPPLLVEMDSTQFDQVVMNLVVNARDATPAGGTISVKLADTVRQVGPAVRGTREGRVAFVQITVADTGTGIPPEVLPHIFEPFFSTKKAGEGTGLGLATIDGIVRRAGGRIDVSSEAGKGTRFDVLIPRVTAA